MSTALAIAGVTQLIRDLLNDGLVDNDVAANISSNIAVHARAPDLLGAIEEDSSILNVFLYQVDPQPNWANEILPTRDGGGHRVNNTPLALDLHYLISAISSEDLHADILLGFAMQILHEHPGFDRAEIEAGLNPNPAIAGGLPPALRALAQTGLADQIEQLSIAPVYLGVEEMSKLWTSFQTHYRSSMAYRVSSVIIAVEKPSFQPLPVLTIGPDNTGPEVLPSLTAGPPWLRAINLPLGMPSARPGDVITLTGLGLEGADMLVRFDSPALPAPIDIAPDVGGNARLRTVTIPDVPASWAAGQFAVSFLAAPAAGDPHYHSNTVAFQLAPVAALPPANVTRPTADTIDVTLGMKPDIWPGQRVELILGAAAAIAPSRRVKQSQAVFRLRDLPAGSYPLRLRVDGVESWLVQREVPPTGPDFKPKPPQYDSAQVLSVPV
jgi:hypothetical protein